TNGENLPNVDQDQDRDPAVTGVAALLHPEDLEEPPPVRQPGELVDHGRVVIDPVVLGRGSTRNCALTHPLIVLRPAPTHNPRMEPFGPRVPFGRFSHPPRED